MTDENKVGEIHDENSLFLRMDVGKAQDQETGEEFELSVDLGGQAPIVRSLRTGKWYTLGWNDIVRLAVASGISEGPALKKKGKK